MTTVRERPKPEPAIFPIRLDDLGLNDMSEGGTVSEDEFVKEYTHIDWAEARLIYRASVAWREYREANSLINRKDH